MFPLMYVVFLEIHERNTILVKHQVYEILRSLHEIRLTV